MSGPNVPDERIAALATELSLLGRRLDAIAVELLALRTGTGTLPAGPVPQPAPYPAPPHPGPPVSSAPPPYPGPPVPPARSPRPHRLRTWLSSLSGARLLAWTGGAVTLLGVVLLLALAASRGWFSPAGRVAAGAVLGLLLVAAALRLHRRVTSRPGALALAGTGVATLYLDVAAATALYGFVPDLVGLLLALLVAAGGLGLADRWRARPLAIGAVVGAAVLAPVLTDGATPLLVALVLVLDAAAAAVALRRGWPVLALVATAWPVLYGMLAAELDPPGQRVASTVAVLGVLLVGTALAVVAARPDPPRLPTRPTVAVLVASPLPALTLATTVGGWGGAALAAATAAVLACAAAIPLPRGVRIAAVVAGAVALLTATVVALDGASEAAALLGQALVLLTVAAALVGRVPAAVGAAYGVLGTVLALSGPVPTEALATFPAPPFVLGGTAQPTALVAGAAVAALVLAVAVAGLVAAGRLGLLSAGAAGARLWAPVGVAGLYGAAGLVIALALLVAPVRAGFVGGHAVVTVSWTVVALALLARGIRRPALRIAGLVLVAAAVAKLVLFDLVALDGLARVAAFLVAGLLLLAAGTRYARLVAEADRDTEEAGSPR